MQHRIASYDKLHNDLEAMPQNKLVQAFNSGQISEGYGKMSVTKINGKKVFIKKLPCTSLEHRNHLDTSNLFDLPTFYNYGVGSAGINCFRELQMHIKTTGWVLNGDIVNFPLLYHWRVAPVRSKLLTKTVRDKISREARYWNSDKNIKKYLLERAKAPFEIIMVIEYFPTVLHKWLKNDINNVISFEKQVYPILDHLHDNNIIHFDAHQGNFMVDNHGIIYLTDFGLVLDTTFNLSAAEIRFFNRNRYHTHAVALSIICQPLLALTRYTDNKQDIAWLNEQFDLGSHRGLKARQVIYDNMDTIFRHFGLGSKYKALVKKYHEIEMITTWFFKEMVKKTKNATFPDKKIEMIVRQIRK